MAPSPEQITGRAERTLARRRRHIIYIGWFRTPREAGCKASRRLKGWERQPCPLGSWARPEALRPCHLLRCCTTLAQSVDVAARTDLSKLAFTQHDVTMLDSVSHLISVEDRCGIYVLDFDDGEQYVGQSNDVVTRFASHRRRWADISQLHWHTCARTTLDEVEQGVIAGKLRAGVMLRNIKYARGPLGVSPLDTVVTPDDQLAWINGDEPFKGTDTERQIDRALQLKKRPSYEKLQKDRRMFAITVLALNAFVNFTIPRPAATERKFWVLSAMPTTNRSKGHHRLATLSINKVEVFWLFSTEHESEKVFWGQMQLSKSLLTERLGTTDFASAIGVDPDSVHFEEADYETSGGDGLVVRFFDLSWFELLQNEAVVEAARSFNLMLLRKGTSPLGHHHNYDLAECALDSDPFKLLGLDAADV